MHPGPGPLPKEWAPSRFDHASMPSAIEMDDSELQSLVEGAAGGRVVERVIYYGALLVAFVGFTKIDGMSRALTSLVAGVVVGAGLALEKWILVRLRRRNQKPADTRLVSRAGGEQTPRQQRPGRRPG